MNVFRLISVQGELGYTWCVTLSIEIVDGAVGRSGRGRGACGLVKAEKVREVFTGTLMMVDQREYM